MCYPYGEVVVEVEVEGGGGGQHVVLHAEPINQFTFSVIFPF